MMPKDTKKSNLQKKRDKIAKSLAKVNERANEYRRQLNLAGHTTQIATSPEMEHSECL